MGKTRTQGLRALDVVKEDRLARTASMYLARKSQAEISRELGIAPSVVSYDINKILVPRWRAAAQASMDDHMAHEFARLDRLEEEYWAGYERSLRPHERRTATTEDHSRDLPPGRGFARAGQPATPQRLNDQKRRTNLTTEDRDGDPAWLEGVRWCVDRRIKLLGLDAPQKIDLESYLRQTAARFGLDPDQAVAEGLAVLQEIRTVPNLLQGAR